jgi:hypothetical protein
MLQYQYLLVSNLDPQNAISTPNFAALSNGSEIDSKFLQEM